MVAGIFLLDNRTYILYNCEFRTNVLMIILNTVFGDTVILITNN